MMRPLTLALAYLAGALLTIMAVSTALAKDAAPYDMSEVRAFAPPPVQRYAPAAVRDRASELLEWIAERTIYEWDGAAPRIFLLRKDQLARLYYAGWQEGVHPPVLGVHNAGSIYLPVTFRLGVHDDRLLHELVHYLQWQAESPLCTGQLEAEAYGLQGDFVRETGIGEIPNPMVIATASQVGCQ